MLYRPMHERAKRMPSRAIGVKWLPIDQSARTLSVELGAPQQVRSGLQLTVPVKLGGLAAGEEARVTVAAVDLGILNLTRFEPPQPERWFHGQRRLGTEIRDFYGRLIDGMRAERGRLRSGGDEGGGLSMQGRSAGGSDTGSFLRHRRGRSRRHGLGALRSAGVQRHGPADGGGLECG